MSTFCQPVYERLLFECVARGRVNAPGFFDDPLIRAAYCRAVWDGPAQGHLNPVQEATAIETRTRIGITTTEQETSEYNGGSFDENMAQIKRETQLKNDAGLTANQTPAPQLPTEQKPDEENPEDPDKPDPEKDNATA